MTGWGPLQQIDHIILIDINGNISLKQQFPCGLHKGSKSGPFGFRLYAQPFAAIHLHLYTDVKSTKYILESAALTLIILSICTFVVI